MFVDRHVMWREVMNCTSYAAWRSVVGIGIISRGNHLNSVAQLMSGCVLGMAFLGFPRDGRSKSERELAVV